MKKIATWNPTTETWEKPTDGMLDLFDSEPSAPYSATWPTAGMTRSGSAFELPTLEPRTVASVCSSWRSLPGSTGSSDLLPTPQAQLAEMGGGVSSASRRSGGHSVTLKDVVEHDITKGERPTGNQRGADAPDAMLPTPAARDEKGPADPNRQGGADLSTAAEGLLPTPSVSNRDGNHRNYRGDLLLPGVAENLLPTPTAKDEAGSGGSSPSDVTLTDAVERTELGARENPRHMLPTPTTEPHTGNGHARHLSGEIDDLLPTPNATLNGYDADPDAFEERRLAAIEKYNNSNGFGTPLGIAARTLPDDGPEDPTDDDEHVRWGKYRGAILRTQRTLGRLAPSPTLPDGKGGKRRLAARFVEWMMLLVDGWVTGVPGITRRDALKLLGNGVVPDQARAASLVLLDRVRRRLAERDPRELVSDPTIR